MSKKSKFKILGISSILIFLIIGISISAVSTNSLEIKLPFKDSTEHFVSVQAGGRYFKCPDRFSDEECLNQDWEGCTLRLPNGADINNCANLYGNDYWDYYHNENTIGSYTGPNYCAIDFADVGLIPIHAAADGIILDKKSDCIDCPEKSGCSDDADITCGGRYGNFFKIENKEYGYVILYAHLKKDSVDDAITSLGYDKDNVKGQKVKRGDILGYMGNSGGSRGQHLHFDIQKNNRKLSKTECDDIQIDGLKISDYKANRTYISTNAANGTATTTKTSTIIVIDKSDSMNAMHGNITKIGGVKAAAVKFFDLIKRENDQGGSNEVGLVSFNSAATVDSALTKNMDELNTSLNNIVAVDGTNIGDALEKSIEMIGSNDGMKIIVLLSDGGSNTGRDRNSLIEGPDNYIDIARQKQINIYTIGYGDPTTPDRNYFDEDLLKKLADGTGGKYYFGATGWELDKTYTKVRAQSTGDVVAEFNETIKQGEKKELGRFDIKYGSGELFAVLNWPGSNVDIEMRDPAGKIIDENYPGATVWNEGPPKSYIIKNPKSGKWAVTIIGTDIPGDAEPVQFIASVRKGNFIAGGGGGGAADNSGFAPVIILIVVLGISIIGTIIVLIIFIRKRRNNEMSPKARRLSDAHLKIANGKSDFENISLYLPYTTIGRDPSNDIVLNDDAVSRHHAKIICDGKTFMIEDMGSNNGTFVNQQRITKASLVENSEIKIGKVAMIFKLK